MFEYPATAVLFLLGCAAVGVGLGVLRLYWRERTGRLGSQTVQVPREAQLSEEAYHVFYREALNSGAVFTFSVDGGYPSDSFGQGGLVKTFLFWSSEERALCYRDTTHRFQGCALVRIPLEEFCTTTRDVLTRQAHMVTVATNESGELGASGYNRGIEGLRQYLDHYRLHKDEPVPNPGFWGGNHEFRSWDCQQAVQTSGSGSFIVPPQTCYRLAY
jgi:hypothetical protein